MQECKKCSRTMPSCTFPAHYETHRNLGLQVTLDGSVISPATASGHAQPSDARRADASRAWGSKSYGSHGQSGMLPGTYSQEQ